jgi:hypothetical protein
MKYLTIAILGMLVAWGCAFLVWAAHQYETVGYGLNPWIALPVATACTLLFLVGCECFDLAEKCEDV